MSDPDTAVTDALADPGLLVELVVDALEPLGFESYIIATDGSEPCCTIDLGDGKEMRITATVAMWCDCCDPNDEPEARAGSETNEGGR